MSKIHNISVPKLIMKYITTSVQNYYVQDCIDLVLHSDLYNVGDVIVFHEYDSEGELTGFRQSKIIGNVTLLKNKNIVVLGFQMRVM